MSSTCQTCRRVLHTVGDINACRERMCPPKAAHIQSAQRNAPDYDPIIPAIYGTLFQDHSYSPSTPSLDSPGFSGGGGEYAGSGASGSFDSGGSSGGGDSGGGGGDS